MSVQSDSKPRCELLVVTESAVQGLNKPHGPNQNGVQQQSAFSRKQRSDNDARSSSSESTTESRVLINSTNVAVENSRLKASSQVSASQQMDSKVLHPVRVPASILCEVKSPFEGDCFRSGYVVDKSDRNFVNISLSGLPNGAESEQVDAASMTVSSTEMEPVAANAVTTQHLQSKVKVIKPFEFDRTIAQAGFRPIMTDMSSSGQSKMSHATDSRPAESSTASNTEPEDFVLSSDKPKRDHPLMVILDSGYLTQPINAVVREETGSSLSPSVVSEASTRSPIVVHAKNRAVSPSETGSTYSTSSQPEVITVSGVTVPVLPRTASAVTVDSSDTDNLSARPFVALKDRFHKFRPVTVKQGTETKDSVAHPADCIVGPSDELRVEHFKLTEKETRLRQEFLNRQKNVGAAPVKKFVPAHVVQSTKDVEVKATTETLQPAAVQSSATVTADSVATTAVAAVMASQTFMKVQQDLERQMSEVLTKISALQESSKQTQQDAVSTKIAEASHSAAANNAEVEIYRRKMEELEKQLSGLTQQRLDYLEKLHQQQLDIQMQLLAMGKQNVAVGHARSHTYDVGSSHIDRPVVSPPTRYSKSDTALRHGIEQEKAALLDTPAPRKQRPVPTFFDPVSVPSIPLANQDLHRSAYDYQSLSVADSHTPPKQRQSVTGPVVPGYRNLNPGSASGSKNGEDERITNPHAQHGVHSTEDMYAKKLDDTFSLTPEKRLEPAPLDKYLMNPSTGPVDVSPYPSLKKTMSSHMPALLQYAEAEALLKKVQATSKRLESNIDTILKVRQDVDLLVGQSGGDDSSGLMERIRVRKLVDQRVQAISKQLEVEIEQERIKMQNEKNRHEAEAKQNAARVARFRGAGYQQPRHSTAAGEQSAGKVVKLVAEKENVPKKVPLKKPRPLDPVQDEEYMKRIYGKALYHKQRNAQRDACQRYHGSPKSKLPQSPVRMSRAVVKGVEVAAAKTQTTATVPPLDEMCYNRPVKGHFVVGLKGKLIPVAIPVELPKQSDHSQHYRPVSHSPPMNSRSPPRQPSPVLHQPPPPVEVKTNPTIADDEDEEEEEDSTLIEDKPMISLPGHTAPPIDGSKFPARKVPLPQHEESADDIAAKVRRSEMLHSELINMVEQELLARIIFEMQEKGMAAEPVNDPTGFTHADQSETSVESEDASEAFIADAIGPQGVQMFVDAGQSVNNALVTALVRDVLAERIAAMLGERAELDRLAKQRQREERQSAQVVVEDPSSRVPRFPVATPQPTPVPSPMHSPSRTPSPLETPLASVAVIIPPQQPVVEEQPSDDEEEFPSYHGASDVESEKASSASAPFVEQHDIRTPSITPTYSPVRSIGTPSLSQEEFLPPAAVPVQSVVERPPSPVVTAVRDAAVDCQLLPVEPPERPPSPSPPSLSTEVESEAPPSEEESLTINECISEGQWLVSVLSEGEVPDAHVHQALRNRIRQHLMNGSRHRERSDDEDTVANSEELDQDDRFTGPRSEGELYHATHPSAEQAAMLDILLPKPSLPPPQRVVTASSKRQPLSSQRSMGEISVGQVQPFQQSYDDIYQPYGGGQPVKSSRRSPAKQPYVASDSVFDGEASAGEYNPRSPIEGQRRSPSAGGSPSPPPQRDYVGGEPSYAASKSGGGPVKQQGQKQRSPAGTGRISSTLEPNARQNVRKYQQPAGKLVDFSQPDSSHLNQAATFGSTFGRATMEPGNATQSDLMTRTTATTDRMSPNALLASRDYFGTASDLGATASSVGSDGAVPRKLPPADPLRATLDTADSLQFTDTAGDESDAAAWRAAAARDTYGSDSLADTVGGNLRATFSVPQQHSHLPIKIPTIGVDNEDLSGSDEISEISVEQEMA